MNILGTVCELLILMWNSFVFCNNLVKLVLVVDECFIEVFVGMFCVGKFVVGIVIFIKSDNYDISRLK